MIWILLFLALLGIAYWHLRENRQLAYRWQQNVGEEKAEALTHFAWVRTAQLLGAIIFFLVVLGIYEWQLRSAHSTIDKLAKVQEELQARLARPTPNSVARVPVKVLSPQERQALLLRFRQQQAMQAAKQQQASVAAGTPAGNPAVVSPQRPPTTPPVAATPAPATAATAQPPATQPAKPTVDDVYNPEKKNTDNSSAIDALKKRYENVLVTYMYLKKCNRVSENDYPIITSALGQEMASINAPGRLQYDILTAAQGSYQEIYSKSSCTDSGIDSLTKQYTDYIKAIAGNLPVVKP